MYKTLSRIFLAPSLCANAPPVFFKSDLELSYGTIDKEVAAMARHVNPRPSSPALQDGHIALVECHPKCPRMQLGIALLGY